jgi:cytochrome c biogenesis protein CcmG, thiol:disulfide interchange protein DsbE
MSETISTPTTPTTVSQTGKKPIRWTMIGLWLAIIGLLAVLAWGLINTNAVRPEAGQNAPDFEMSFFNGYEWEGLSKAGLSDMQGRPVVLNFWASWCVECRYEAELLEQTWRKYRDDGVIFLGVAYVDTEPKSLEYMNEFAVTYPHAPDLGTRISRQYEITGVPETFFIDKNGVIRHVQIGPMSPQLMDTLIPQLLEN